MRVLVCGGRDFTDKHLLFDTLSNLHRESPIVTIIEGDQIGADRMAGVWGRRNNIEVLPFPADWRRYGSAMAGPVRNQKMIDEGKPDIGIAFPTGGPGTQDMMRRLRSHKLPLLVVTPLCLEWFS